MFIETPAAKEEPAQSKAKTKNEEKNNHCFFTEKTMLFFKKNLLLKLTLYSLAIPLFIFVQGCLSRRYITLKKDGSGQMEVMYTLKEGFAAKPEQDQNSGAEPLARPASQADRQRKRFKGTVSG
jgi:hypothetical protein